MNTENFNENVVEDESEFQKVQKLVKKNSQKDSNKKLKLSTTNTLNDKMQAR